MQCLNIKERKLLELQITQTRHHLSILDGNMSKIVSEYDQEIPQSQTADKPMAPQGRAKQQSQDARKLEFSLFLKMLRLGEFRVCSGSSFQSQIVVGKKMYSKDQTLLCLSI